MRIVLGLTRSLLPSAPTRSQRPTEAARPGVKINLVRCGVPRSAERLDRLSIVYGQPQSASRLRTLSSSPEIVDQDPGLPGRRLFRYDAPERAPLGRTDDAP